MATLPFLEDIYPENLLYAATIRSPVARGFLKEIESPALPRGYVLITAKDIPGENRLEGTNMPIFACDILNYIGEPVAILLGDDKTKLEELVLKCRVNAYEDTPVFDMNDPKSETEIKQEIIIGDISGITQYKENASRAPNPPEKADINDASEVSYLKNAYTTGIQEHWYAEPIGAVTWLENQEPKNTLVVMTATQWPAHVKKSVTNVLGADSLSISISPTALNLHMDGKFWYPSLIACHAAIGTYITKKPVRFILSKEEDFLFTPKRCETRIDVESIINKNGTINALEIDINVNLGSYAVNAEEILDNVCIGSLGMYKFDNVRLIAKAKKTNLPPQGAFSGFGIAQGNYAIERHISHITDFYDDDPCAWRLNYTDTGAILPVSITENNNVQGGELIKAVIKMSDYKRKRASNELLRQSRDKKFLETENPRGIGIASGYQTNGLLNPYDNNIDCGVEVTLTKEGAIEIKSNIVSSEDYQKIWEKVIMETITIEPDMIRIVTENAPDCGPSCSSRNITSITKLVKNCCESIVKQRFHEPLPITVKEFLIPRSGSLRAGGFKVMDINSVSLTGAAAAVVEVMIDRIDYTPVIRGIWLAVDGGKIISTNRAKRNLNRSVNQALGWVFTENIAYINGIIPKRKYDNFKIFSPSKIPPVHIEFLNSDLKEPKGIGDLPFTCVPAAFMQAVSQAADHVFNSIPLNKNDIWNITRQRNSESANEAASRQTPKENQETK
ncbi:MAG: xanthine dehydrogenase family protein molybdopterin-binding subunit [Treponema sp.]|nr:xanthine dehydrogenase family protein molybdopterin-binding subunit [Treponema sp.]